MTRREAESRCHEELTLAPEAMLILNRARSGDEGLEEEAMSIARNTFTPEETAMLGRVFESGRVADETEVQKEARASRIIANYMAGITDEAELIELSRRPLGR